MAQYSVGRSKHYGVNNNDIHEVIMLADQNGNIINTFGSASNIPIAAGLVDGYSHINKFGATDGDVTAGTVWDGNSGSTFYPYPTDGVVSITSTANAGASVEVQGLDASYNQVTEIVTIGGTGLITFSRVFRARMVDTDNTQDVIINQNASLAAKILAGLGQTLMAVYTIPAGKTGYFMLSHMGSDKASTNTSMIYRIFARPFGGAFNIKGNFNAAGGQSLDIEYPIPLKFEEKTDIKIDIIAGQATQVSATFDIVLVDNPA
jgi:hypothetical protein